MKRILHRLQSLHNYA